MNSSFYKFLVTFLSSTTIKHEYFCYLWASFKKYYWVHLKVKLALTLLKRLAFYWNQMNVSQTRVAKLIVHIFFLSFFFKRAVPKAGTVCPKRQQKIHEDLTFRFWFVIFKSALIFMLELSLSQKSASFHLQLKPIVNNMVWKKELEYCRM